MKHAGGVDRDGSRSGVLDRRRGHRAAELVAGARDRRRLQRPVIGVDLSSQPLEVHRTVGEIATRSPKNMRGYWNMDGMQFGQTSAEK